MSIKLKIIHSNDTHSYVENFGHRSALINDLKLDCDENTIPLLFDAGDLVSGSIFYTLFKGKAEIEIMNLLNYDYVGIGNHDFDQGVDAIEKYISDGNFKLYCANLKFKSPYEHFNQSINQYDIKVLPNGQKVGIVSLLTTDTIQTSLCNNVTIIDEPMFILEQVLMELKKQNTDYIILLSHLGYEIDKKLAQTYQDINLIIGGHSHTLLEKPDVINNTIIVQSGMYGKYLGELVVNLDNTIDYYKQHLVDDYDKTDDQVQSLIEHYQKKIEVHAGVIVGHNKIKLEYNRADIYQQDSEIGNLITDAYFNHLFDKHPYINGAIINGHGIRNSLAAGEISVKHLINILPFNKNLCIVKIPGSDLFASLKLGISPQVSHLKLTYENEILTKVHVYENNNYQPLENDKTYYIVTNDFVARGKDNYIGFSYDKIIHDKLGIDYQVVANYISKLETPVTSSLKNRIVSIKRNLS
jgi:2',3'-cyclic-nucleotide 2'-phosphodiesterase (5'-nucleotidase family)